MNRYDEVYESNASELDRAIGRYLMYTGIVLIVLTAALLAGIEIGDIHGWTGAVCR